jgi:hypothetical protein
VKDLPVFYKILKVFDWNRDNKVDVMVQSTYIRDGVERKGHGLSYYINKDSLPATVEEINNNLEQFTLQRRYKDNPSKVIRKEK